MPREIERKYLVTSDWNADKRTGERLTQGYISVDPVVRVRMSAERGWLTIKGVSNGIARDEFEYEIPHADALQLLSLCGARIVDKTRYHVEYDGNVWDVDVFHGDNAGLVTAEIEMTDEKQEYSIPPFVGRDVSNDDRYANSSLACKPWSAWSER